MMEAGESWASVGADELAFRFRSDTDCGHPESGTTSGLVAYLDGEPVGWCAVEPRSAYPRLLRSTRVPWDGRTENKNDDSVWAAAIPIPILPWADLDDSISFYEALGFNRTYRQQRPNPCAVVELGEAWR